ncbi:hypothetical protein NAPIS_ORF01714 [Vairimorpha apis BRL 01]|uniref:Uncharacterized protein n=1 Tax=Vairimorpha apis BRL 01 TaxID=1037528 RepID=T0MIA1_9MICR|nr:hypothetical protein NAPIS_ORF01714 [Vairimorpha apis BRL 01]
MFLFLITVLSYNIYKLNLKAKNYIIFDYETSSVLSYDFLKDVLSNNLEHRNLFFYKNENSSELYFYKFFNNTNTSKENRVYIIEKDKNFTLNNFLIPINRYCELNEIIPKFLLEKSNENIPIIKVENYVNFSKVIWNNILNDQININKTNTINIIYNILNETVASLTLLFKNYPLLFFKNNEEKIKNVFEIILNASKYSTTVEFNTIYNSLKNLVENYNDNYIMQRYHSIKGQDITEESKDFCFSCLLTDISNILGYFNNPNQYCFEICNIVEYQTNFIFGQFFVGVTVDLNINIVKHDYTNKPYIFIYDNNNVKIDKFITIDYDDKFTIFFNKLFCLQNDINRIKVIIHTINKIYESNNIDLKKNIYD